MTTEQRSNERHCCSGYPNCIHVQQRELDRLKAEKPEMFNEPTGCGDCFAKDTELQQLKEQLAAANTQIDHQIDDLQQLDELRQWAKKSRDLLMQIHDDHVCDMEGLSIQQLEDIGHRHFHAINELLANLPEGVE